jgi:hypothetical protein
MPTAPSTRPALHIVQVRYQGGERSRPEGDPIDAYAASDVVDGFTTTVVEPIFPEERRDAEPTVNLGLIGGEIAAAVAEGRRAGEPVLVVGGNCAVVPVSSGACRRRTDRRRGSGWSGSTPTAISTRRAPPSPGCLEGCRSPSRRGWRTPAGAPFRGRKPRSQPTAS